MVKKGDELNKFDAIRYVSIPSPEIAVGVSLIQGYVELELYQKNLVIMSKLDKLPVLEKLNFFPHLNALTPVTMNNSGVTFGKFSVIVYNCEYDDIDDDHRIAEIQMYVSQSGGVVQCVDMEVAELDYNIPLRNKITFAYELSFEANVTTVAFTLGRLNLNAYLNIDYVKVTNAQLQDWVLKEVFLEQ